jgi:hypothetical protein
MSTFAVALADRPPPVMTTFSCVTWHGAGRPLSASQVGSTFKSMARLAPLLTVAVIELGEVGDAQVGKAPNCGLSGASRACR